MSCASLAVGTVPTPTPRHLLLLQPSETPRPQAGPALGDHVLLPLVLKDGVTPSSKRGALGIEVQSLDPLLWSDSGLRGLRRKDYTHDIELSPAGIFGFPNPHPIPVVCTS